MALVQSSDGTLVAAESIVFSAGQKMFTQEQLNKYKRIFDMFDINKNGMVESGELHAVAEVLGYRMPREQLQSILALFNFAPGRHLTFEEFMYTLPGSGNIPQEEHERAEIRRKFQEFDKDRNGYITKDEAYLVLSRELGLTKGRSDVLLQQFDINSDGKLSYEEFVVFYQKVNEKKALINEAFTRFDEENKGYITIDDAKCVLGTMFSEREVENIFRCHDLNRDGVLQYEEFARFWTAGTE